MNENHVRSHFSPFQINTQVLFYFFHQMAASGILDARKITLSHFSHFIYKRNFFKTFFSKWQQAAIFANRFSPKSIVTFLTGRSMATSNKKLMDAFRMKLWCAKVFSPFFTKWPPSAILIFWCSPKEIRLFHSGSSMAVINFKSLCFA